MAFTIMSCLRPATQVALLASLRLCAQVNDELPPSLGGPPTWEYNWLPSSRLLANRPVRKTAANAAAAKSKKAKSISAAAPAAATNSTAVRDISYNTVTTAAFSPEKQRQTFHRLWSMTALESGWRKASSSRKRPPRFYCAVPAPKTGASNARTSGYLRRSLMPEGLLESLGETQVSDLFAYLKSAR